jgi:AcrR family transcriptional regulator
MMATGQSVGTSRREEYADATRRAIMRAARQLFSERGYFATKVDDIAALARVAPATVYAVSGGKHGLLRALTDTAITDPIIESTIKRVEELDNPAAIVRLVAATVRGMHEEFGDFLRVLLGTAPHDKAAPCESRRLACRDRCGRGGRCVLVLSRLFGILHPARREWLEL